jgi:hypothetical protein
MMDKVISVIGIASFFVSFGCFIYCIFLNPFDEEEVKTQGRMLRRAVYASPIWIGVIVYLFNGAV